MAVLGLRAHAMIQLRKTKSIFDETPGLRGKGIDHRLLKVFTGEKKGTRAENRRLNGLKKNFKDDLYRDVIYALSHKIIEDARQAKDIYFGIIRHRDHLNGILGRNIGIEVAALDYLHNILVLLNEPAIIERGKFFEFLQEAARDEKTGALSYRAFRVALEQEMARTKRYLHPFALLFIDIDHFKEINDTYGHMAGDAVLKKTTEAIKGTLRSMDKVCRYGGDELLCLLPEISLSAANITARRVAANIADTVIHHTDHKLPLTVTASIGVVQYDPDTMSDAGQLVAAADRAMYQAKKIKQNQRGPWPQAGG